MSLRTQVKVIHASACGPAGALVEVDIRKDEGKASLKAKLAPLCGIPVEHQKLLMGAFSQIAVGDKRHVKFGSCGTTEGFGLAYEYAQQGVKPHIPPATANRIDNNGAWGAGDRD